MARNTFSPESNSGASGEGVRNLPGVCVIGDRMVRRKSLPGRIGCVKTIVGKVRMSEEPKIIIAGAQ